MNSYATPTELVVPSAAESLDRCRELVAPALRDVVDRLHPGVGAVVEFALGWRDADGAARKAGGGKGMRPALAILAAEAVGARTKPAVAGAVAVELVHVFSLVHDDIMDGDEERRHRDAAWKAFGVGPAVLAGDAMLALAMETLADTAEPARGAAMNALSTTLVEIVNGQAADVSFELRPWTGQGAVTVGEYRAMAELKTGSLIGCAAALGAVLGGAPPETAAALRRMGRHLGLAFQAIDDLLGIWGDPAVTGKPVFNDLRQRKKTLPVIAALTNPAVAVHRLAALLEAPVDAANADRMLRDAADLIEQAEGRSLTSGMAREHLNRAYDILCRAATEPRALGALTELFELVVNRVH